MTCNKSPLISGFLLLLLTHSAYGQAGWQRVEIPGVSTSPFLSFQELHSGVLLVGTKSRSLYRSTDHGTHWEVKPVITDHEDIWSMAVTKDGTLLAATSGAKGICRSVDDGETFTESNIGLLSIRCAAFGVNPESKWILAATFGVYRSSDNGKTWSQANEGLEHRGTTCFAFDDDEGTYVGTDGGLAYSENEGDSWRPLLSTGIDTTVTSIVVADESTIYAGTNRAGILRSTNHGNTWSSHSSGLEDSSITTLIRAGSILFAGTQTHGSYFSKIGSDKWSPITMKLLGKRVYQIYLSGESKLFAVTDSGLFQMNLSSEVRSPAANPLHVRVSSKQVTVENSERESVTVAVFDLLGRQVVRRESRDGEIVVDLSGVSAGSYFLRATCSTNDQSAATIRLDLR